MAIELITGKAGTPHIDSADVGAFQAYTIGEGVYVLNGCEAAIASANSVTVAAGDVLAEGRHFRIVGAGETLPIGNGQSGYKRNDIVAAKYTRDGEGIERVELVVVPGTPAAANQVDPSMPNTGSVLDGATIAYWPLYRVTVDGLTPLEPVMVAGENPNRKVAPAWTIYEEPNGSGDGTYNGGKGAGWTYTTWNYIDTPYATGLTSADEFTSKYFTTALGVAYRHESNNSLITIVKPGIYRFSANHFTSANTGRIGVSVRRNNGSIMENSALSSNNPVGAFGEVIVRCAAGDIVGVAVYVTASATSYTQYLHKNFKFFNIQYLGE